MEHAVLGAGAIGGLVGTAVASLSEGVTLLVRPERLPGYPGNLSVERPSGVITAPAKVAATLPNPVDVLWIATKTYTTLHSDSGTIGPSCLPVAGSSRYPVLEAEW